MQTLEELNKELELYKKRERELTLRIEELSDFIENASLPIHWVDSEGKILWANQAELDLLGYTEEEYLGQSISNFHADQQVLEDILSRLTDDQTLDSYPATLKCKDGSIKHVLINSNVYRKEGKFIHTRCLTKDITNLVTEENRKTELLRELERSEARLQMAIDSTKLGTWDYNPVSGKLVWSDECRKIYAFAPEAEINFEVFARHIHPEDRELAERAIAEAMNPKGGGTYATSYRILRFGTLEPRWIQASGKVYFNEKGQAIRFFGTVLDITDVKQATEKIIKSEKLFKTIALNIPNTLILIIDKDQRFVAVEGDMREKLGYVADESYAGKHPSEILPAARYEIAKPLFERALRGEKFSLETKSFGGDDLLVHVMPLKTDDDKVYGAMIMAMDITQIKQAEEKGAKLAAIVESSDDAIISKNLEGIISSWNASAQRLFGYTADEIIGKSVLTLIPEDRQDEEPQILARLSRGERIEHFETKRITKDRRIIDLSLTISPVKDSQGNIIGVSKIARDITEIKRAEEATARLAAIIQSSDDAIISKTLEGIITSWNASAQRLFGYTADEIIGKSILTLIPEDRQDEEPEILARLSKGERIEHFETKRITKDRRIIDLSLTISPVKDSLGNIIGVSKIARDITEIKRAEEATARLAAIIQSSDDAIISKTLEGIITSWNNSAQRLFGYTADEIIGKSILTLIPEDRHEEEPRILARLRRGERVEHFETKRVTKDGRIIDLSLTISPVRDSQGRIIGLSKIARDITEKKQEEIRKNDFIAIVSHELKTPLTSVKSYIQVLLAKAMKDGVDFTINALSRAEVQTNKMTYMINDFLSLARLGEGKIHLNKEHFELQPLLHDLAKDAQFIAAGHVIELEECEKLVVHADKDKISQVMINLLSNAIKYSPKGSKIIMGCEKHNEMVKIFVSDEGVGISSTDQKRLFERFYRVENEKMKTVSGFGIGLYLVAEILKIHGSKIEVESEVGRGSTFWFEMRYETSDAPYEVQGMENLLG